MRYIGAVLDGGGGDDTMDVNVVDSSGMPWDWNHLAEIYLLGGGGDDVIRAHAFVLNGSSISRPMAVWATTQSNCRVPASMDR